MAKVTREQVSAIIATTFNPKGDPGDRNRVGGKFAKTPDAKGSKAATREASESALAARYAANDAHSEAMDSATHAEAARLATEAMHATAAAKQHVQTEHFRKIALEHQAKSIEMAADERKRDDHGRFS